MTSSILGLLALTSSATDASIPVDQPPAVEYSSLLSAFQVQFDSHQVGKGGRLRFGGGFQVAFLPGPDIWNPMDTKGSEGHRLWASLSSESGEVARFAFYVNRIEGVFSRASVRGLSTEMEKEGFVSEYTFEQAGTYTLTVYADDEERATLPFQVRLEASGDPLQPQLKTRIDGPWQRLGYFASRPDKDNPEVRFHTWLRSPKKGTQVRYEVEVYRGDEHLATGGGRTIGMPAWEEIDFKLNWAVRGKGSFGAQELCAEDGDYRLEITADGEPFATYPFQVEEGQLVPHEASVELEAPAPETLVPMRSSQRSSERRRLWWVERSDG